jgi:hypothetical protein
MRTTTNDDDADGCITFPRPVTEPVNEASPVAGRCLINAPSGPVPEAATQHVRLPNHIGPGLELERQTWKPRAIAERDEEILRRSPLAV